VKTAAAPPARRAPTEVSTAPAGTSVSRLLGYDGPPAFTDDRRAVSPWNVGLGVCRPDRSALTADGTIESSDREGATLAVDSRGTAGTGSGRSAARRERVATVRALVLDPAVGALNSQLALVTPANLGAARNGSILRLVEAGC